ncbi:MAG: flagellar biosynthetic protein FliO [Bacteriovoracaceae bacterium]|nr:flagellar biosynthetic protein FliO [Bacteriovoracaceae bacterium]
MRIMLATIIALLATVIAHAGVKVTNLEWSTQGEKGKFVVTLSAPATEAPEWDVKGGRFAMNLPAAEIEKNTVKKIEGVRLAAANTARGVLATLTFPQGVINADNVALTLKDGKIEITTKIPQSVATEKTPFKAASPVDMNKRNTLTKQELGEDYLKKIEAELNTTEKKAEPVQAPVVAKPTEDTVSTKQAATKRDESFSFVTYAGKFIAFLGVVLLFFWGIIQLMKKGVLSKGKLGFLNNTQLVSVLSTTYVAPKRSLLVVKAHNQVFLVSSSENGMSLISEIKDVPGLVKESERVITGTNFDDNVDETSKVESPKEMKIKEDIYQSTALIEKAGVQKDIVRFSDELKKKVKNLKSLQ